MVRGPAAAASVLRSARSGPQSDRGRSVTQPEEIANGCLFLLSDLASGITGQNLVIDVGATIDYAVGGVAGMARKIFDAG